MDDANFSYEGTPARGKTFGGEAVLEDHRAGLEGQRLDTIGSNCEVGGDLSLQNGNRVHDLIAVIDNRGQISGIAVARGGAYLE